MPEIPECLSRRYKAVDELIEDLSKIMANKSLDTNLPTETKIDANDPSLKLMCEFWDILKQDPDCNLTEAVKRQMRINTKSSTAFGPKNMYCFMSQSDKLRCCSEEPKKSPSQDPNKCCSTASDTGGELPLTKVLCNLKEAASFDKKCTEKIASLVQTQKVLQDQISKLEEREKEGAKMLKQADCMWTCMEDAYKKKIADTTKATQELIKKLKEVDVSNSKWRKNKKDLELQMVNLNKCHDEIKEKTHQKLNDIKTMEGEIADYQKRIENGKRDTINAQKSLGNKKTITDTKITKLASQTSELQKHIAEETKNKFAREQEGNKDVREARELLQNLCRTHLQKKLENEDLASEKQSTEQEIEILKKTYDTCKEKCNAKKNALREEIRNVDKEIAGYKNQCIRCHQCTDTFDNRRFCVDCPKCAKNRECKLDKDHCIPDPTMDCVCMPTKRKFLDNVFDNMYTVLARQGRTNPGKAVADQILKNLQRSRNGKLNDETKIILQDFILNTVKRNLNLTIVGGAVKTRCEMDPDTYKQLMTCINKVKAVKPPKVDKGTVAKKESCRRWGGPTECNCPKGPKYCICQRKAPPPPNDPTPCPPDPDDVKDTTAVPCPHKKKTASCGVECGAREPGQWVPAPCGPAGVADPKGGAACFGGNMRAAQCVLGPDALDRRARRLPERREHHATASVTFDDEFDRRSPHRTDTNQLIEEDEAEYDERSFIAESESAISYDTHDRCDQINFTDSDDSNNQLKIVFESKKSLNDITTLKKTASGNYAMSLKKKLINEIEEEYLNDKNINVTVHDDDSNLVTLGINRNKLDSNKKVFMRKTPSGTRLLKVNKNIIKSICKNCDTPQVNQRDTSTNDSFVFTPARAPYLKNIAKKPSKNPHAIIKELTKHFNDNKTITIKVQGENGYSKEIVVPVIKTSSENIAIDVQTLPSIGDVAFGGDHPVTLALSSSGEFTLQINRECDSSNAVLRETASGKYLVVVEDPESRPFVKKQKASSQTEDLYTFNIKDSGCSLRDVPCVLKKTPSDNYIVIIDKEYEKRYKETINNFIEDETSCSIQLIKTDSEKYEIDMNDCSDETSNEAIIVKSDSGNIKIIANKTTLESFGKLSLRKKLSHEHGSKLFNQLLHQLPKPVKKCHNLFPEMRSPSIVNSLSDSQLYNKFTSSVHSDILFPTSSNIKKTDSGQYAIVLDKDLKKTFIHNLQNILSKDSRGMLPIKKTDTNDIIIELNSENPRDGPRNTLKITPSGKVFIMVDESLVDSIAKDVQNSQTEPSQTRSIHIIGKVQCPEDKAVATTCRATRESSCDRSKCVCNQLEDHNVWLQLEDETNTFINRNNVTSIYRSEICCITNWNPMMEFKNKCKIRDCKIRDEVLLAEQSSLSLINQIKSIVKQSQEEFSKAYTCEHLTLAHQSPTVQSFYVIEARPLCEKENVSTKDGQHISNVPEETPDKNTFCWDCIEFMPHQLPEFLRNN